MIRGKKWNLLRNLETINNLRTTFICGDFNVWLGKVSECNYVGKFVKLLEAHSLVNMCNKLDNKI